MNLDKQKIIQIIAVLVLVFAFVLLALFWENEHKWIKWKNPLEVSNYSEIDERFLELLENDYSLNKQDLKSIMDSNSWTTLKEILKEKWIEFKFRERD